MPSGLKPHSCKAVAGHVKLGPTMRVLREGADLQGHPDAAPVGALQEQGVEAVQDCIHRQRLGAGRLLAVWAHPCIMGWRGWCPVRPGRARSAQPELGRAACGILCVSAASAPALSQGGAGCGPLSLAGSERATMQAGPCGGRKSWACGQAADPCAGARLSMHCSTDGRQ